MSAPLCSCDTYGSSGLKNTCSTAGPLHQSIRHLERLLTQADTTIAEQKEQVELAKTTSAQFEKLVHTQAETIRLLSVQIETHWKNGAEFTREIWEQKETIADLNRRIEGYSEVQMLYVDEVTEQSELIEELADALEHHQAQTRPIAKTCEALAEYNKWKELK